VQIYVQGEPGRSREFLGAGFGRKAREKRAEKSRPDCSETALELACGADFSRNLMCGAGPGDLEGSRGCVSAENPGKTGLKISSQTAFRYPVLNFC